VKCSEDGKNLIVRLAEQHNSREAVTLEFDRPIGMAWTCNLMEEVESEIAVDGRKVRVNVKPYEVVTVRVELP
jgi:alpha-mannosidase